MCVYLHKYLKPVIWALIQNFICLVNIWVSSLSYFYIETGLSHLLHLHVPVLDMFKNYMKGMLTVLLWVQWFLLGIYSSFCSLSEHKHVWTY